MKASNFILKFIFTLVFSPKGRESCICEEIQNQVYSYISKTITNKHHKSINVNGMPDHIHILIGLNTSESISDLVRDIKRSSSLYINNQKLVGRKFHWQEGYGAFSYSKSQLQVVYNYIQNQKTHHMKRTFKEEYLEFLEKYQIEFEDKFLFDFYS